MKELIIKIKPVLEWKPIKSSDDEVSIPRWQGVTDIGATLFTIEKQTWYYLYIAKKKVGVLGKLKNAKACAELLYNG